MSSTEKTTQEETVVETTKETSSIEAEETLVNQETVEEVVTEEAEELTTKTIEVVEPLKRVTIQKPVEKKVPTTPVTEEVKTPKPKKKRRVFLRLIQLSLLGITVGVGYEVANFFYFEPMKNAGVPVYGTRLDEMTPITEAQQTALKTALGEIKDVQNVEIVIQGASIYTTLTVESESLEDIQMKTETVLTDWVTEVGESTLNGYALQSLITTADLDQLVETNRESEANYVKEHKLGIVETIIAHTETYPTAANIQRSQANINILTKKYPEEAAAFQARVDQLKEYTAEEEAALEIPELIVDQTVPTSDLAQFPSWGVYQSETSSVTWY